jgi:hypothetical protein
MPPTIEQIKDANDQRAEYKPPRISAGDDVVWFPNADPTRTPHVGHAVEVYPTALDCTTSEGGIGQFHEAVRHVSDPELVINSRLKVHGAWDYPQKTKDRWAFQKEVRDRLTSLEERLALLDGGTTATPAKRGPGRPRKEED